MIPLLSHMKKKGYERNWKPFFLSPNISVIMQKIEKSYIKK